MRIVCNSKIKQSLCFVLLISLMLCLCACQIGRPEPAPTPTPEPTPTPTPEPTPEPVPTLPPPPNLDITSWEFKLANSYNSIGVDYIIPHSSLNYLEGQEMYLNIYDAADSFLKAARAAGFEVWISVAYRNNEWNNTMFMNALYAADNDPVLASTQVLAPGLSDHQTGLAIDFSDKGSYSGYYGEFEDPEMADTELFAWLKEHCAEYGFIFRYPEGKEDFYGVKCKHPAHFRYVGQEAARYITENNLCLEEFLMMYDGTEVYIPEAGYGMRIDERRNQK